MSSIYIVYITKAQNLDTSMYKIYNGIMQFMQLDENILEVWEGSTVCIPDGAFHKVFNDSEEDSIFICLFQKYDR